MPKKINHIFFLTLVFTIVCVFTIKVEAKTTTVKNQQELLDALDDKDVSLITITSNIETTQKINITRNVKIDGQNHTLKYVGTFGDTGSKDNTVWGGIYILQAYKCDVTIKDITLTGGNAGLLVNGANVTLEGTIDVSGNGFGGIEVSQGAGVTEIPKLELTNDSTVVNKTESSNKPTLWVPEDTKKATLIIAGIEKSISPQELSLNEVYEIFGIENPKTGDNITIILTFTILSFLTLIFTINNLLKKEF